MARTKQSKRAVCPDLRALSKATCVRLAAEKKAKEEAAEQEKKQHGIKLADSWVDTHKLIEECVKCANDTGQDWCWVPFCSAEPARSRYRRCDCDMCDNFDARTRVSERVKALFPADYHIVVHAFELLISNGDWEEKTGCGVFIDWAAGEGYTSETRRNIYKKYISICKKYVANPSY
jgi:hypothetical protein